MMPAGSGTGAPMDDAASGSGRSAPMDDGPPCGADVLASLRGNRGRAIAPPNEVRAPASPENGEAHPQAVDTSPECCLRRKSQSRATARGDGQECSVHLDQSALLVRPCQLRVNPTSPNFAHNSSRFRIVHELGQAPREIILIAALSVHGCFRRGSAVLGEIKRYDRLPDRHVLCHLDHGRSVGEGVEWIGSYTDICSREVPQEILVRYISGEPDV